MKLRNARYICWHRSVQAELQKAWELHWFHNNFNKKVGVIQYVTLQDQEHCEADIHSLEAKILFKRTH